MKKLALFFLFYFLAIVSYADLDKIIYDACRYGDVKKLQELISKDRTLVDKPVNYRDRGFFPIHLAACYNQLEILELLLQNEANVNQTIRSGHTALIYASLKGYVKIVECLLKQPGIDINLTASAVNGHANNALTYAWEGNHTKIVTLLIKKGINNVGSDDFLLMAVKLPDATHLIEYLISKKHNPHQRSFLEGLSPWEYCKQYANSYLPLLEK